jgi:hypothetical protein
MTSKLANPQKSTLPSVAEDPRWARIVARVKAADGQFWYSVSTTGVYCRPSCPSRTANPTNIQLHDTLESAKATGFRPCKRCNPDGGPRHREVVVIGQSAETATQQLCRCRTAHLRECRIAPDRTAVTHDPQHRRSHDVVERGQCGAHKPARLQPAVPRSPPGSTAQRELRTVTRPSATAATTRLYRAASRQSVCADEFDEGAARGIAVVERVS